MVPAAYGCRPVFEPGLVAVVGDADKWIRPGRAWAEAAAPSSSTTH